MKHLKFLRRPGGCHGGWGWGFLFAMIKFFTNEKSANLGFGDVIQYSIKHKN